MSGISVDAVRDVIDECLGDRRLDGVKPDERLLRVGLLTSIEVVSILVALEKAFGVRLEDSRLDPELFTLAWLASAVDGGAAVVEPALLPNHRFTPFASYRRAMERPALVLSIAVAVFFALNVITAVLVEGPFRAAYLAFIEDGKRFYPMSGHQSHDDFVFASRYHEIRRPLAPGHRRIVMLGDSGTVGSYLGADESLPALVETLLRSDAPTEVMNLAWFGQLFAKDLMLLETVWNEPFHSVVIPLRTRYFSKHSIAQWTDYYNHFSVNRPLFDAFITRIPQAERGPFEGQAAWLARADRRDLGPARRILYGTLPLLHYRPFLQDLWYTHLFPGRIDSLFLQDRNMRHVRYARQIDFDGVEDGLDAHDFDERIVAMLRSTVLLLQRRGVSVTLFLQPSGPREWRPATPSAVSVVDHVKELGRSLKVPVVDTSWLLGRDDFLDNRAHFTAEANRRLAVILADELRTEKAHAAN